jgi:hypothetical protein
VDGFSQLTDDGKTACGCWIYSGCYTEAGNMMARRDTSDPADAGLAPKWQGNRTRKRGRIFLSSCVLDVLPPWLFWEVGRHGAISGVLWRSGGPADRECPAA